MQAPIAQVAVIVGHPETTKLSIERLYGGTVTIKHIHRKVAGKPVLAVPYDIACSNLDKYVDAVGYENAIVVVLPYAEKSQILEKQLQAMAEMGTRVVRVRPDGTEWPNLKPPNGGGNFVSDLSKAVSECIDHHFPQTAAAADKLEEVKEELLRGLMSHSKMGENNHSHEDDFWKQRGAGLTAGQKGRVLRELLDAGLIGRKKNKSAGGTGMVYWVGDVPAACTQYPALLKYVDYK